jgi:hypothetical protein
MVPPNDNDNTHNARNAAPSTGLRSYRNTSSPPSLHIISTAPRCSPRLNVHTSNQHLSPTVGTTIFHPINHDDSVQSSRSSASSSAYTSATSRSGTKSGGHPVILFNISSVMETVNTNPPTSRLVVRANDKRKNPTSMSIRDELR